MARRSSDKLSQLIGLLEPLGEEERLRTVRAALMFLGSHHGGDLAAPAAAGLSNGNAKQAHGSTLTPRAARWLEQHGIDSAALENIFHWHGDEVAVIAEIQGRGNKEKVRQCYLLTGAASLLKTGEAAFEDEEARSLCREHGCYDNTNHSKSLKALRGLMTGDQHRVLTQPGLREAAQLIKEIAKRAKQEE